MTPHTPRIVTSPTTRHLYEHLSYNGATGATSSSYLFGTFLQPGFDRAEEWLADVGKGRGRMNDCSHYRCDRFSNVTNKLKYASAIQPDGSYVIINRFGYWNSVWPSSVLGSLDKPWEGSPTLKLAPLYYTSSGHKYCGPNFDVDALCSRSLQAMWPEVRTRISLINTILELKDFVNLPRQLRELKRFTRDLKREVLRDGRRSKDKRDRMSLRRILKQGAEGYLTYSFAIAPMLRDIEGLVKALKNYRREVQNLLDRERIPQLRHYEVPLTEEYPDKTDTARVVPYTSSDGDNTCSRSVTYPVRKFNATMEFSYELSDYERENALMGGLLDSIGVNCNPAIIWNALPWSFVVDWVANLGAWFNSFKLRQLEPRVVIRSYCWSVTLRRHIQCQAAMGVGGTVLPANTVALMVIDETAYVRRAVLPQWSLLHSLEGSGLSRKEISLAVALASTR
jgi:hypothetical protein